MTHPPDSPKCACGKPLLDGQMSCGDAKCESKALEDLTEKALSQETRPLFYHLHDKRLLKKRFDELAEDVLPGEGFSNDDIMDGMIRSLCSQAGNPEKLTARFNAVVEAFFDTYGTDDDDDDDDEEED
jgi:hypothetical protein